VPGQLLETATESSTDPLTEPQTIPTHQSLTTNPTWKVSLTLTLGSVVSSHLDVDDNVITFHIPLPTYFLIVHCTNPPTTAHRLHLHVASDLADGSVELSVIPSAGLMPTKARGNYLSEAHYLHEIKMVRPM